MKSRKWGFNLLGLVLLQLVVALPLMAATYSATDIALSPGADATKLNFNWHTSTALTDDGVDECAVEISKKRNERNKHYFLKFPKNSAIFYGTKASAGSDENGNTDYYCEVEVSRLENQTQYVYRVGDGDGNWSNQYEYATANKNKYNFVLTADSQIGASGSKDYSTSEAKAYIADYEARIMFPGLTEAQYAEIVTLYVAGTLTTTYPAYTDLNKAIKKLYDTYKVDTTANLTTLAALETTYPGAAVLATNIVALRAQRLVDQKAAAASDTEGWVKTFDVISENFPRPAFIMTSGDQVENAREYEWTGFFSPEQLTSIPVAPAIGSHDAGANFGYHFNLPNESTEYGVSTSGGDYYFTYGNTLFIVLNMDATMNLYPRTAPPSGGGAPSGPPPSGGGGSAECEGIDDDATFAETLYDLEHGCTTNSTTGVETCTEVDGLADFKESIEEHRAFIQEAVAANPRARWKIVNWHYSIYSAGNHSAEDVIRAMKVYMVPVIDEFDIDLGLMAHDHVYTRTFQMLGDDPQDDQIVGGKTGWVYNPTGTLFITGATTSGSKYYSLNNCYDCDEPDDYYEYVALGDDMSRIDDNDTPDVTTDDVGYKTPNFTYISVDNNSLKLSSYAYRVTNEDTGDYTKELIDTYTILKVDPNLLKIVKKWPFLF